MYIFLSLTYHLSDKEIPFAVSNSLLALGGEGYFKKLQPVEKWVKNTLAIYVVEDLYTLRFNGNFMVHIAVYAVTKINY